jgi:hypothetical protein
VKRVRVFVHPSLAGEMTKLGSIDSLMTETLKQLSS